MYAAVWLLLSGLLCSLQMSAGSFPKPLTAQEEQHYLQLSAQGDLEARNILIERNLRLVAHIMKKYYAQTADQEDLISIGTIGLIKGITTFDTSKGARLATYAARCVENATLSPAALSAGSLYPKAENTLIGAFWTGFRRICTSFVRSRIRMCGMYLYIYIVSCCALPTRFWKPPGSISAIADTRRSGMCRTGSGGAGTVRDLCGQRWQSLRVWPAQFTSISNAEPPSISRWKG